MRGISVSLVDFSYIESISEMSIARGVQVEDKLSAFDVFTISVYLILLSYLVSIAG